MFPRLAQRAVRPALVLRAPLRHHIALRPAIPTATNASIRHQSSSSSRRDNENQDNPDVDPVQSKEASVNASFELHRIDLAHGSFFAMHRPLLGITNGPMFANTSSDTSSNNMTDGTSINSTTTEGDYEDPVDDLSVYFSSLHPYLQATPMFQVGPISSTAVAWASYPPSLVDSNLVVDQFLGTVEAKLDEQSEGTDTTAHIPTTSMEGVAPNDTTSAMGIVSSAFGSQLSGPTKMYLTSVLRKRRIKMKKHKYNKLRKRTRALRKKLGK
ncbi:MAG: hypothetical protein J3Q66DRAFT_332861 [Benniella sp.]|nr:MAG: hypothetical protein J3Q66DRAFT_332861 [Benniella sp.]